MKNKIFPRMDDEEYLLTIQKMKYIKGSGNRLKYIRENLGLSQNDIAKMLGYSNRQYVYKLEQAETFSAQVTDKISKKLNVSAAYIAGFEDSPLNLKEIINESFNDFQKRLYEFQNEIDFIRKLIGN